jgi:hypothetical protein
VAAPADGGCECHENWRFLPSRQTGEFVREILDADDVKKDGCLVAIIMDISLKFL